MNDATTGPSASGPLQGLRVIELGSTVAGPFCARLFADFGADVIEVEQAEGDAVRSMGRQRERLLCGEAPPRQHDEVRAAAGSAPDRPCPSSRARQAAATRLTGLTRVKLRHTVRIAARQGAARRRRRAPGAERARPTAGGPDRWRGGGTATRRRGPRRSGGFRHRRERYRPPPPRPPETMSWPAVRRSAKAIGRRSRDVRSRLRWRAGRRANSTSHSPGPWGTRPRTAAKRPPDAEESRRSPLP